MNVLPVRCEGAAAGEKAVLRDGLVERGHVRVFLLNI